MTDRESEAASKETPVDVRPGQVKAAKGLEIRTVHPQWSVLARLTARPRNALVKIKFGRRGDVIKAEFMPGGSTGNQMVDEPLLHAIYRWTAKGEVLMSVPEDDPRAGVTIVMRILLSDY